MPLHFVDQSRALQAESRCCAILSADYPASCVKGAQNQGTFGILRTRREMRRMEARRIAKRQAALRILIQRSNIQTQPRRAESI
jgi:hypothetical protein